MKAGKVTGYGIVILGLLASGGYVLHVKASSSDPVAMPQTSGVEKKVDHAQTTQKKVSANSTEVDDATSVATTSTRSLAAPSESTDSSVITPETISPSSTNTPTAISHGSWFNIPGFINWNHVQYHIDPNKRIASPGRSLGTGADVMTVNSPASSSGKGDGKGQETININYPVFEIPGIDSSQAIAVDDHQVYFEAFVQK